MNARIYVVFRVPKATRLKSQVEYAADKTIPVEATSMTAPLMEKIPRNTRISPIKFDVPGKPMLAKENVKKNVANKGMTAARPP